MLYIDYKYIIYCFPEADFKFERLTKSRTNSTSSDSSASLTSNGTTHRYESRLADMPDLIPYDHKHSLPHMNNTSDSGRSHKKKEYDMDKQEVSALDSSFPNLNKTESRMKATTAKSQSAIFNLETNSSSRVKVCRLDDQQSDENSCQGSDRDSRMRTFTHQANSLTSPMLPKGLSNSSQGSDTDSRMRPFTDQSSSLTSPMLRKGSSDSSQGSDRDSRMRPFTHQANSLSSPMLPKESSNSSQGSDRDSRMRPFTHQSNSLTPSKLSQETSEAASQNFINIGRGSSFSLPKFGNLIPQACPPGSLQKKRHVSHLLTCADAVQMPPLIADTDDTTSDVGWSPSTAAVSPLNNGSAFDGSVLTGEQQQKASNTATVTSSRNLDKSLSPRDGCRLKNSRSHDMDG